MLITKCIFLDTNLTWDLLKGTALIHKTSNLNTV